jgi:hypothetical protein
VNGVNLDAANDAYTCGVFALSAGAVRHVGDLGALHDRHGRAGVAAHRRGRLHRAAAGLGGTNSRRAEFSDRLGAGRITLGAFAAAIMAGGFLVAVSAHGDLTYRTGDLSAAVTTIGYIVETPAFLAFLASHIGAAVLSWARDLRPHHRAQPPG